MKLEIHRFGVLSAKHSHPLVFIHGEWHGAWCWEEKFVPFFRRHGFLCVTMDLRGHGGSEGKERLNDWKLEDYVADLAQMVEEVGQDPILVGHSMGAAVSQIFASQHRVVGMALLCPIPIAGYHDDAVRLFKDHPWITFLAEVTKNADRLVKDEGLVRHLFLSEKVPDKDVCRYYCQLQGESLKAIQQCVDGVGVPASCQVTPIMVIGREGDEVVSPQSVHRCAGQCHVREVMVPGSGHDIMLDWGWERAAESVLAWADAL